MRAAFIAAGPLPYLHLPKRRMQFPRLPRDPIADEERNLICAGCRTIDRDTLRRRQRRAGIVELSRQASAGRVENGARVILALAHPAGDSLDAESDSMGSFI